MGCVCSDREEHDTWAPPSRRSIMISNLDDLVITPGAFIHENLEDFFATYRLTDKFLGKGNFTEVRECVHLRSGQQRAVKIIHKSGVSRRVQSGRLLLREVSVLKHLSHPNIVRVFEFFEDRLRYYIVMELCSGRELFDLILASGHLDEFRSAHIMEQLLSAVSYCHSLHIVHRDLKPENVIVEDRNLDVKLIDFDSATFFDVSHQVRGYYGTTYYMAPEVILGDYDEKCDVWSLGVILYVLLSGRPPFWGYTDRVVKSAIVNDPLSLNGKEWLSVSASAKDLISRMLTKDQSRRISASEAFLHPWIQNLHSKPDSDPATALQVSANMKDFHSLTKLKAAVRTFVVSQVVDSHEFRELREMFQQMDRDGDGLVSERDLVGMLTEVMSREEAESEAKSVVRRISPRADGLIDYNMFLSATADMRKLLSESNLRSAFMLFDSHGSGRIQSEDLRELLSAGNLLEDSVWRGVIQDLDDSGRGEISLKQFLTAMAGGRSYMQAEDEEIRAASPLETGPRD